MTGYLFAFALASMEALAPGRDHSDLATAIVDVVEHQAPLFKGDVDRTRTLSFALAVAYRESGFRNDAIGDHGRARCAFQLWSAPKSVLSDPRLCTSIAFDRLRESMRICGPKNVLGIYASGPKGCVSEKAKRISRDRLWLATRIHAAATGELAARDDS